MAEFFEILAQGRQGGEQWVTLLIFIVIVAVNVIGGIIKAAKSNTKRKDEDSDTQSSRQYKPAQQWSKTESRMSTKETPTGRAQASPMSNLDMILRARREQLQAEQIRQQRINQQAQLQEQFDHNQRAQLLEIKRQRLIEQKSLAEQRQKLQQQKELMLQMPHLAASPRPEPRQAQHHSASIYELIEFPAEQLQNILVACEIMGKPVSMRENDERLF